MKQLDSIKRGVDRTLAAICIVLFMLLVIVVCWQVIARQLFAMPSQWSETLARYVFVWVGFLGAAYVFGERGHVAIDVAVRLLPKAPQRVVGLLVQGLVIVFSACILLWGGTRAALNAWSQNLSGIPTTIGPWYLVLPIAGAVIIFYSIHHAIKILTGQEAPFAADEEVAAAVAAAETQLADADDTPSPTEDKE